MRFERYGHSLATALQRCFVADSRLAIHLFSQTGLVAAV
jgi:hypothetical protein